MHFWKIYSFDTSPPNRWYPIPTCRQLHLRCVFRQYVFYCDLLDRSLIMKLGDGLRNSACPLKASACVFACLYVCDQAFRPACTTYVLVCKSETRFPILTQSLLLKSLSAKLSDIVIPRGSKPLPHSPTPTFLRSTVYHKEPPFTH